MQLSGTFNSQRRRKTFWDSLGIIEGLSPTLATLTDLTKKNQPDRLNWTTALAIVDSVKHFPPYLLGGHFTVVTDHRALTFLEAMKGGGPCLTRWALVLQPSSFDVRFRPGNTNANADGLSRQDLPEEQPQRQTLPEIAPDSLTEKGGGVGTMSQPLQPTDSNAGVYNRWTGLLDWTTGKRPANKLKAARRRL